MAFKEILRNVVDSVEGGVGAVVMGYDGIAIDEYIRDDGTLDVQLLAVEYATVLKEVKKTVDVLRTGEMKEVSIITDACRIVIRAINEEFFVVLALTNDGNYGKGRYLLRREAANLGEGLQ